MASYTNVLHIRQGHHKGISHTCSHLLIHSSPGSAASVASAHIELARAWSDTAAQRRESKSEKCQHKKGKQWSVVSA